MKNKILKELLEKYPELAKDSKKLEEIITILKQNNPEIKVDENFKNSLKSRLDSITDYKKTEQKSFFPGLFLVPILSIFLIIGGVFYIYKDISLLKDDNIKYQNTEIKYEKNKNSPIIPFIKGNEDTNKIEIFKTNTIINEQKNISLEKKNFKKIKSVPEISKMKEKDTEIITKKQNIEDNQILEMLGEDTEIIERTDEKILDRNIIEDSSVLSSETSEALFYDNGNNESYINSFKEYYNEYNSKILVNEDGIKYCIIEDKICLESKYFENTCKLIEKK